MRKYHARAVKGGDLRSSAYGAWVRIPLVLFLFLIQHHRLIYHFLFNYASHTQSQNHRPPWDAKLQSLVPSRKLSFQLLPLSLSLMVRASACSWREWWGMWICSCENGWRARRRRSLSSYYISFSLEDSSKAWIS